MWCVNPSTHCVLYDFCKRLNEIRVIFLVFQFHLPTIFGYRVYPSQGKSGNELIVAAYSIGFGLDLYIS